MTTNNSSGGGFRVQNLDTFDPKYRCSVCSYLLRNPAQLVCGHRQCQTCIPSENTYIQCSVCKEQIKSSEIKPDKGFQKDMQPLQVCCISCEWFGQLRNYQQHLEQSHRQFKCSYCGDILNSQSLLEEHIEKLCLKIPVNCKLQQYGCQEQSVRGDLERHFMTEEHQTAILVCVNRLDSKLKEQYQASAIVDTHIKMETSNLSSTVTTATTATSVTEKLSDALKYFHDINDLLTSGIHTLNDELTRLNSESLQKSQSLEMADELLRTIKTSIEESDSVINAVHTNFILLQQTLSSLKQQYDDRHTTSYDGTLVWKIDRFQEKMNDAKSERQVSIYSPPFFSSSTGYRMRARLYLYGDGNARRTHMSLFFVIMRGPYDCILQFPFSYKVTFCLFDQTGGQRHIVDSFRPDIKSNSFQRPRSDMNIASGIPKFAPLSTFETPNNPYIKEDTMFIKVMVDFQNMSKAMLPFALNLNPGLPMHTQQKMIQEEIEKRALQSQSSAPVTLANTDAKKK